MNKSTLNITIPQDFSPKSSVGVSIDNFASARTVSGSMTSINMRAVFESSPNMVAELDKPVESTNRIPNNSFNIASGSTPAFWTGSWDSQENALIDGDFYLKAVSDGYNAVFSSTQKQSWTYNYREIISGSFVVATAGITLDTLIRFKSVNGSVYVNASNPAELYVNINGGPTTVEPVLHVYVNWYDSGSALLDSQQVMSARGQTSTDLLATVIGAGYTGISSSSMETLISTGEYNNGQEVFWKELRGSAISPNGVAYATVSIRINLANENIYPYSINVNGNILTYNATAPIVEIEHVLATDPTAYIIKSFPSGSMIKTNFDSIPYMTVTSPTVITEPAYFDFGTVANPVTGHATIFEDTPTELKFGKETDQAVWSSWIPFGANFDAISGSVAVGAHITTACLVTTVSKNQASLPSKPCFISAGFDSAGPPTSSATLASKTSQSATTLSIIDSWVTGEEQYLDLTTQAKAFFGDRAIRWDKTNSVWNTPSLLLKDATSSINTYRSITHTLGTTPKLILNYEKHSFRLKSHGTFMNSADPDGVYFSAQTLLVGASGTSPLRSLLWFDLGSLGDVVDNATSATLRLRLLSGFCSGSPLFTLNCYQAPSLWDSYGATWNRRVGTERWSVAGVDLTGLTLLGSVTGSYTTDRDVEIQITGDGLTALKAMKTGTNHGFLLKLTTESSVQGQKGFVSQNRPTEIWARPRLYFNGNENLEIRHLGDPETGGRDVSAPTPPPSSKQATVIGAPVRVATSASSFSYTLRAENKSNRLLAVFAHYPGAAAQAYGSATYPFELKFEGVAMTKYSVPMLLGQAGVYANNWSSGHVWVIPLDGGTLGSRNLIKGSSYLFSCTPVAGGEYFIKEFSYVKQATPVHDYKGAGSNSATSLAATASGLTLAYPARGHITDWFYIADSGEEHTPVQQNSGQVVELISNYYGMSHYIPPLNTGGNVNINWIFPKDGMRDQVTDAGVIVQKNFLPNGSTCVYMALSLTPE